MIYLFICMHKCFQIYLQYNDITWVITTQILKCVCINVPSTFFPCNINLCFRRYKILTWFSKKHFWSIQHYLYYVDKATVCKKCSNTIGIVESPLRFKAFTWLCTEAIVVKITALPLEPLCCLRVDFMSNI